MAAFEEDLVINPSCTIGSDELRWRFSGSGGPGGQHANTANTRVELLFDVARSPSLNDQQRQLLIDRLGPTVRIVVSDERSQTRNRELARSRFIAVIGDALKVRRKRRATRPTLGSREKRLQTKQLRSTTKGQRRRPEVDE